MIKFYKYQGTGNDFVIIDDRGQHFSGIVPGSLVSKYVKFICNRRCGIGADGLIFLRQSPIADFEMKYYNANGSIGSMCGNGGRCIARFAEDLGIIKDETIFLSCNGLHKAILNKESVNLEMGKAKIIEKTAQYDYIDTGSPHYVSYVNDINSINVINEGRKIRFSKKWKPSGTNVNFIQIINKDTIYVRTYERGVESETLSCGTGITASAISYSIRSKINNSINVFTKGGQLKVLFDKDFQKVYLIGPACKVFEGTISYFQ